MLYNPPVHNQGVRFALNAKDSLVSWINTVNLRSFTSDQFSFEDPIIKSPDGWVTIKGIFLPTNEDILLTLQRVDLSNINGLNPLVIHTTDYSSEGVAKALLEQYGILLDLDLFELNLDKQSLDSIIGSKLNGFGEHIDDEAIYLGSGDADGIITISPSHYTLEGTLRLKIRTSMLSYSRNIDSVLKLRDYYSTSDESKPWVETIQPNGVWTVNSDIYNSYPTKKSIDAKLYESTLSITDDPLDFDFLANVLSDITQYPWTVSQSTVPFNVMGSRIKYNGVAGKHPNIAPIEYSYLMIIELGDKCSNLQGDVHIAYQYVNDKHPLYGNKTLAGAVSL